MDKQHCNATALGFMHDLTHVLCCFFLTGEAECEVKAASENELQCVMQSEEKTHIVTNQGSHHSRFTFRSFLQASKLNLRRLNQSTKERRLTYRKTAASKEAVTCRLNVTAP